MDIYTLGTAKDLPKTMGSVEALEHPRIIEVVINWPGPTAELRKRHSEAVYIHQWEVIEGILHQRVAWGIS